MNFFLYPIYDSIHSSSNPYIFHFRKELEKNHRVVNSKSKNYGVISLFTNFLSTDIFILNWIETIPEKRFGIFQVFMFVVFTWITKIFKRKIVWILHNKGSHHKGVGGITMFMFDLLLKQSDLIITHSFAGRKFVQDKYPSYQSKTHVIFHPVLPLVVFKKKFVNIQYDFLIWGSIHPYKGIDKFLTFLKNNPKGRDLRLLIVGKCSDPQYKSLLLSLISEKIKLIDHLFEIHEIANFAKISAFTLFTYKSETVLSSGSLMDSIRMGAMVIGPNHGSFQDMSSYSFVKTYETFEDIFKIREEFSEKDIPSHESREIFFKNNTWSLFVSRIVQLISGL